MHKYRIMNTEFRISKEYVKLQTMAKEDKKYLRNLRDSVFGIQHSTFAI